MRLSAFRINRYGIFSDIHIPEISSGINIFYGENEAGKSTLFEFLRLMLTCFSNDDYNFMRNMPVKGEIILDGISSSHIKIHYDSSEKPLLYDDNNTIIDKSNILSKFSCINKNSYNNFFAFNLNDLQNINSINAEEARKKLYGCSFGPGLASPDFAINQISCEKDSIFKPEENYLPLNANIEKLGSIRREIAELKEDYHLFDALNNEFETNANIIEKIKTEIKRNESEKRIYENKLNVWLEWKKWHNLNESLKELGQEVNNFPADGASRLTNLENVKLDSENRIEIIKHQIQDLKNNQAAIAADEKILEALPLLRSLWEQKSSYRDAVSQLTNQTVLCESITKELENNLEKLGAGWSCERIRLTDRSLFTRKDMEKQAEELNAAHNAWQAESNELARANRDVENINEKIKKIKSSLEDLAEPKAILDEKEREYLRNNLAALAECTRSSSARERAYKNACVSFERAVDLSQIKICDNGFSDEAKNRLLEIMSKRDSALEIAKETQELKNESAIALNNLQQADYEIEKIKGSLERQRDLWRTESGFGRERLESQARNLRLLRTLCANIEQEKERLKELDTRLSAEKEIKSSGSRGLLSCSLLFFLAGGAIGFSNWFLHINEWKLSQNISMPVNLWAAYVSILCGVIFFGFAMPGKRRENNRRIHEIQLLQDRRDNLSARLNELLAEAGRICTEIGIDDFDPYTLDAKEALLEREREQCIHEEHFLKDIERIKEEYENAKKRRIELSEISQNTESKVQKSRRRWHLLMQSVDADIIPLPENADVFFARIESALLAYENMENAKNELDALWEDFHILESAIQTMPAIMDRLHENDKITLEEAARQILDDCKAADMIHNQKTAMQENINNLELQHEDAMRNQKEVSQKLEDCFNFMEQCRKRWKEKLAMLGLSENLTPETLREAFGLMENCLANADRKTSEEKMLEKIRNDMASVQEPLKSLLLTLEREPVKNSMGETDWLATLDLLLNDAEDSAKKRQICQNLAENISQKTAELAAEENVLFNTCSKKQALLELASVKSTDEFFRMAKINEERHDIKKEIAMLEKVLVMAANDTPMEEFVKDFSMSDQEEHENKLSAIKAELDSLNEKYAEKTHYGADLKEKIKKLASDEKMKMLRQEEELLVESVERMSKKWMSFSIAGELLKYAKKIYEKENQPEIMRDASVIFDKITGGEWKEISICLDNSNIKMHSSSKETKYAQELSMGTQQQAYLSIRLAYIRKFGQLYMPLPLMLDEILVNFDESRAANTCKGFTELAKDSAFPQQILYFTCHRHMVEMLKAALPESSVFLIKNRTIQAETA